MPPPLLRVADHGVRGVGAERRAKAPHGCAHNLAAVVAHVTYLPVSVVREEQLASENARAARERGMPGRGEIGEEVVERGGVLVGLVLFMLLFEAASVLVRGVLRVPSASGSQDYRRNRHRQLESPDPRVCNVGLDSGRSRSAGRY